jgi:glycosyltransferase involved in cell wall biosynthesis
VVGRLLYVINNASYFVAHWERIARAARERGAEVHIAAPRSESCDALDASGFRVHRFSMDRGGLRPLQEARASVQVWQVMRRVNPRLVHNITVKAVVYGGLAARTIGVPVVVNSLPGLGYLFTPDGIRKACLRWVITKLYRYLFAQPNSRVVFQNTDDLREFVDGGIVCSANASLIRGAGVDPEEFLLQEEPTGLPLVVLASRMLWHKGVKDFVLAAEALKREGVQARFALVGGSDPGSRSAIPPTQLERWQASGAVEWWGHRANMPAVFAQASVVCLPTVYREGLPRVLTEAAACGRALVATDAPGCRDIVRDGENGILVPLYDVSRLKEAIKTLIENRSLRVRMGMRGREIVIKEFALDRVICETLELYDVMLARCGTGKIYLSTQGERGCSH